MQYSTCGREDTELQNGTGCNGVHVAERILSYRMVQDAMEYMWQRGY